MAVETTLHSGGFTAYDDKIINVTFFRRTPLNAEPQSMVFWGEGGTRQLKIWSRTGDAVLYDPQCDWINFTQTSAEPIVGSKYYKYTYNIICDQNNTGDVRETDLRVGIDNGQGIGDILLVHITQYPDEYDGE